MKTTAEILEAIDALPHGDHVLTTAEVAAICGCDRKQIGHWITRGRCGIRLRHQCGSPHAGRGGCKYLVRAKHLRDFLEETA